MNYIMSEIPSSSDSRGALQGSEINFPTRAIHIFSVFDSYIYCGKLIIWLLYTNQQHELAFSISLCLIKLPTEAIKDKSTSKFMASLPGMKCLGCMSVMTAPMHCRMSIPMQNKMLLSNKI